MKIKMKQRWFWPLIIPLAGLIAYHNSFSGPFIFDDRVSILENPNICRPASLGMALSAPPEIHPLVHRPLVALSLAINYQLSRFDVWSYHAFNLGIHLLAALILFGLLRRTLLSPRLKNHFGSAAYPLAWIVALAWVVHPLNTQAVNCIIRRSELLMALFYLGVLYSVNRSATTTHRGFWQVSAVVSCFLGMASKEIMVTAPVMALLYERVFLAQSFKEILSRHWKLYAGLFAAWIFLGIMLITGPSFAEAGFHFPQLTFRTNLETQTAVLCHYFRLAFWPHPLVLDYDWAIARSLAEVLPQAFCMGGLLLASLLSFFYRPEFGFLGLGFFLLLAPTSLLPILTEIAAEHRVYLPLAGILAGAVVAGYGFFRGRIRTRFQILLVVGIVIALTGLTLQRNEDYRSGVSIWQDTASKRPRNFNAHYNLGVELLREERFQEAQQSFRQAIGLRPSDFKAHYNYEFAMKKLGEIKQKNDKSKSDS